MRSRGPADVRRGLRRGRPGVGHRGPGDLLRPAAEGPGTDIDLVRTIRSTVASQLGISPAFVIPLDRGQFPKTTSGKIQRSQLKKSLEAGHFASVLKQLDILLGNVRTLPDWFFAVRWRRRRRRRWRRICRTRLADLPRSPRARRAPEGRIGRLGSPGRRRGRRLRIPEAGCEAVRDRPCRPRPLPVPGGGDGSGGDSDSTGSSTYGLTPKAWARPTPRASSRRAGAGHLQRAVLGPRPGPGRVERIRLLLSLEPVPGGRARG